MQVPARAKAIAVTSLSSTPPFGPARVQCRPRVFALPTGAYFPGPQCPPHTHSHSVHTHTHTQPLRRGFNIESKKNQKIHLLDRADLFPQEVIHHRRPRHSQWLVPRRGRTLRPYLLQAIHASLSLSWNISRPSSSLATSSQ